MRILTVEDSEALGRTMVMMLSSAGHEVRWAANATDTLSCIKAWAPDAVLLDRNLGDTDGLVLAKKVRRLAPKTRLIIVSGDPLSKTERKSVDGFLMKPAARKEILDLLKSPQMRG